MGRITEALKKAEKERSRAAERTAGETLPEAPSRDAPSAHPAEAPRPDAPPIQESVSEPLERSGPTAEESSGHGEAPVNPSASDTAAASAESDAGVSFQATTENPVPPEEPSPADRETSAGGAESVADDEALALVEGVADAVSEVTRLFDEDGARTGDTEPEAPVLDEVALPPAVPAEPTTLPVQPAMAPEQGVHESVAVFYDRSSIISEQYRSLRTRLLTQNPQNEHRVLAVTSAIPREGKSVTTANMGVILAEIRHFKVLCIDGDFRRSRLGQLFNIKPRVGLADYLKGEASYEEIIQPTPIPNLYFVGAGETTGRSAAELLSSDKARGVIQRFQNDFHYSLIDTPPATTVTDVGVIGQMCHGVILIVRMNFTPEPLAQQAVRLLRVNRIPVLGCLLIGREERSIGYGHRYGYYGYYHYYGKQKPRD